MSGLPVAPRRVFGVALDVGDEAGAATWVCRGTPGVDGLRVESVDPLAQLPGGRAPRDEAYRVLLAKLLEAPRSVWGFDFPFGLPAEPAEQPPPRHQVAPWRDAWLGDLRALVAGQLAEATPPAARRTERELGIEPAPWARRRLAVRAVLMPLLSQRTVAILPFDPLGVLPAGAPPQMASRLPSIHVFETYPEAAAESLGIVGQDVEPALRALASSQQIRPLSRALRQRIAGAPSGRGLGCVLAAVCAWRASRRPDHASLTRDPHYGREGYVYC